MDVSATFSLVGLSAAIDPSSTLTVTVRDAETGTAGTVTLPPH